MEIMCEKDTPADPAPANRPESILVVEDSDSLRDVLCAVLRSEGFDVYAAASAEQGLELFRAHSFTVVLSDLKLPNQSGLDLVRECAKVDKAVPVVVMTAYGSIEVAVEAMKLGARDFVTKPFDPEMLCNLLRQIREHRQIIDRSLGRSNRSRGRIITQAPQMERLLRDVLKVAPLSTPVMILGESGTGKELLARYVHQQSLRHEMPFVAVNCGSMPGELLESEFFGHEQGAFTGASEERQGLFEVANGGSIFLDEIANMPHALQVKLLRTLQESEVKRIGSSVSKKIDVRVLSATNSNLETAVKSGQFRDDLYFRLGVFIVSIPPLRERRGDVTLLANYYTKVLSQELCGVVRAITPDALKLLESYHWPGNVRELENVLERALVFTEGPLTADCFSLGVADAPNPAKTGVSSLHEVAHLASREAEVQAILSAMSRARGNKSSAARMLDVSYKTLLSKIKQYEIE